MLVVKMSFHCIPMFLYTIQFSFLLDDVRFIVIGPKLAKHNALQEALKVYHCYICTVQAYAIRFLNLISFTNYICYFRCAGIKFILIQLAVIISVFGHNIMYVKCSCDLLYSVSQKNCKIVFVRTSSNFHQF